MCSFKQTIGTTFLSFFRCKQYFIIFQPEPQDHRIDIDTTASPSRLLYIIGSAESTAQHPIASAIVRMLRCIQSAKGSWKSDFAKVSFCLHFH